MLTPALIALPENVLVYSNNAVEINLATARAFRTKSLSALNNVIDLDPTVIEKGAARTALQDCLLAHADVIGAYD
jgi:alpha-galactosidase/6-phospho-beta-glucosidase family protein